jgi:glutamate-1-semialdehyde 2,1-aminomutase
LRLGVSPDVAVFAKALGNGHPIAAILGTEDAMSGARESFISSTYWTEAVGPVAALATLEKLERVDAQARIAETGRRLQTLIRDAAEAAGFSLTVAESYPCFVKLAFDAPHTAIKEALFVDRMLERGFLASTAIYPSVAHTDATVRRYEAAVGEVFIELAELERRGDLPAAYPGPLPEKDFARLV